MVDPGWKARLAQQQSRIQWHDSTPLLKGHSDLKTKGVKVMSLSSFLAFLS